MANKNLQKFVTNQIPEVFCQVARTTPIRVPSSPICTVRSAKAYRNVVYDAPASDSPAYNTESWTGDGIGISPCPHHKTNPVLTSLVQGGREIVGDLRPSPLSDCGERKGGVGGGGGIAVWEWSVGIARRVTNLPRPPSNIRQMATATH